MPEDIIIEVQNDIEQPLIVENDHTLFEEIIDRLNLLNPLPSILSMNEAEKQKSLEVAEDYLINKNKKIEEMNFYTIFLIIKKSNEEEQIKFFRENIDYISKNDEEIFLYDSLVPSSLVHYLSFNVLKELYNLDKKIINRILNGSLENLFWGIKEPDRIELYDFFYEEMNNMENIGFINSLSYLNRVELVSDYEIGRKITYNQNERDNFISFICEKYKSKINTFNLEELIKFMKYVDNPDLYKSIIEKNKDKFINFCETENSKNIKDFLNSATTECQRILLSTFLNNLIKNPSLDDFVSSICIDIIINEYKKNNKLKLSLKHIIKSSAENRIFNDDLKELLDKYEINSIEELFDYDFYYNSGWYFRSTSALEYMEKKYRDSIITDGNLFDINENTSIFSNEYLKNLKELKKLLKENRVNKDSLIYQKHFKNFVLYLKKQNIIKELNELEVNEINTLFYRIIMGESITTLIKVKNIKEITLYNRLRCEDVHSIFFTVEQLKKYNVKHHKKLCAVASTKQIIKPTSNDNIKIDVRRLERNLLISDIKTLVLKLMLLVGYKHAKEILEIDSDLTTLEHLVGAVNTGNIKLDEQGNPILNKKIINLLFNSKENTRIKEMLLDKKSDLYTYFPRIFDEWDEIKERGKDKSLNAVLELLKSDDILIPKQYYRLDGLFKYIGCSKAKVSETFKLHDKILEREETTIPKVEGKVGEYTYEILDLHDMYAITVGNRTNCCFTVNGVSYSSLKHACTSKNGRILVIKKNDELIAHSWLWRNGNLLCLDNIEVNKGIEKIDFFDVYLEFADKVINKSLETEEEAITNITIGGPRFDKPIVGIENYVSLVLENEQRKITNNMNRLKKLPQPIEATEGHLYTDSKLVQYLIKGNGNFRLGQSNYFYNEKENENIKQKVLVGGKV